MSKKEPFDAEVDMSLTHFDAVADAWASDIELVQMIKNIVSPMRLHSGVPAKIKASFIPRMEQQIDALVRQAFIEALVRNELGLIPLPSPPMSEEK